MAVSNLHIAYLGFVGTTIILATIISPALTEPELGYCSRSHIEIEMPYRWTLVTVT